MIYATMRIERSTLEALTAYRDRLQADVTTNPSRYPDWLTESRISLSAAVEYLLCQRVSHGERRRKSARKKPASNEQPTIFPVQAEATKVDVQDKVEPPVVVQVQPSTDVKDGSGTQGNGQVESTAFPDVLPFIQQGS